MKREKSCGAIIINDGKVLLIQQIDGFWGFPKGHVEEGETEVQTAIREVKEETNVEITIDESKRYTVEYELPNGNMKEVVYFIAQPTNKDIKRQEEEIIEIKWVDIKDVEDKLTFKNTAELFKKAMKEM